MLRYNLIIFLLGVSFICQGQDYISYQVPGPVAKDAQKSPRLRTASSLRISADGKTVGFCSSFHDSENPARVTLCDLASGKSIRTVALAPGGVYPEDIVLSPNLEFVVVCDDASRSSNNKAERHSMRIFHTSTGAISRLGGGSNSSPENLFWTRDGLLRYTLADELFSCHAQDFQWKSWEYRILSEMDGFHPKKNLLVASQYREPYLFQFSDKGIALLAKLPRVSRANPWVFHPDRPFMMKPYGKILFLDNSKFLQGVDQSQFIEGTQNDYRKDVPKSKPIELGGLDDVRAGVFSKDGKFVVASGEEPFIGVWSTETRELLQKIPFPKPYQDDSCFSIGLSSNNRLVAVQLESGRAFGVPVDFRRQDFSDAIRWLKAKGTAADKSGMVSAFRFQNSGQSQLSFEAELKKMAEGDQLKEMTIAESVKQMETLFADSDPASIDPLFYRGQIYRALDAVAKLQPDQFKAEKAAANRLINRLGFPGLPAKSTASYKLVKKKNPFVYRAIKDLAFNRSGSRLAVLILHHYIELDTEDLSLIREVEGDFYRPIRALPQRNDSFLILDGDKATLWDLRSSPKKLVPQISFDKLDNPVVNESLIAVNGKVYRYDAGGNAVMIGQISSSKRNKSEQGFIQSNSAKQLFALIYDEDKRTGDLYEFNLGGATSKIGHFNLPKKLDPYRNLKPKHFYYLADRHQLVAQSSNVILIDLESDQTQVFHEDWDDGFPEAMQSFHGGRCLVVYGENSDEIPYCSILDLDRRESLIQIPLGEANSFKPNTTAVAHDEQTLAIASDASILILQLGKHALVNGWPE